MVSNTAGTEGSYDIVLDINGVHEAVERVTLGAGESETVTFTVAKDREGIRIVDIGGMVGQLTVITPPQPVPTPAEAIPVRPPTNWWLIGGIVAGCVIVAAGTLIYFLVWRKRSAGRPSKC